MLVLILFRFYRSKSICPETNLSSSLGSCNAHTMYIQCTYNTHTMHIQCTYNAHTMRTMRIQCTNSGTMHMQGTCETHTYNAHTEHVQCTCVQCTWSGAALVPPIPAVVYQGTCLQRALVDLLTLWSRPFLVCFRIVLLMPHCTTAFVQLVV